MSDEGSWLVLILQDDFGAPKGGLKVPVGLAMPKRYPWRSDIDRTPS